MVKAQVKRLSGATAVAEPKPVSKPVESYLPVIAVQTEDEQAQALNALKRLGKGIVLWQEQGWTWEEPEAGSRPEDFPPLAKLLWLFNRAYSHMNHVGAMEHIHRPWYCRECQDDPGDWLGGLCDEHIDHVDSVRRWADWLGLRGAA